jgi:mannose-1-phosphate guanylyltransferase
VNQRCCSLSLLGDSGGRMWPLSVCKSMLQFSSLFCNLRIQTGSSP